MIKLPSFQYSVIVGLLLSDGWLRLSKKSKSLNAHLGLQQSIDHVDYIWYVFNLLSHYCNNLPVYRWQKRGEKYNLSIEVITRALPCFTKLHSIFYPNGVKIIPNNIYNILTPIALAHLIMGDGSVSRHGLVLCTDSYSIEDVVRLINVLIIRYRLECSLRYPTPT